MGGQSNYPGPLVSYLKPTPHLYTITMTTKEQIVQDWLPRYTGVPLNDFAPYILLTNFHNYVEMFAERFGVEVLGLGKPMQVATAGNISIINFGMGSPMAATVMDLLSAVMPKAVLFLGKCGGLKKTKLGDLILPIAAIRGEGTSDDYLPPEVPALPSFRLQRSVSHAIKAAELDYYTGTETSAPWLLTWRRPPSSPLALPTPLPMAPSC
jgi:AMP nucleosidase